MKKTVGKPICIVMYKYVIQVSGCLRESQVERSKSCQKVRIRICLRVLLFMALFTVARAHRYEWFNTRVSSTQYIVSSFDQNCKTKFNIFVLVNKFPTMVNRFIYLFGVLHHFQHSTCHIMMDSFVGRGNQQIQLVKVLYCKLPTNGKQLPAFPLEVRPGTEP